MSPEFISSVTDAVMAEVPKLAMYLGHMHVRHSYWYLEAVPELLQLATQRLIEQQTGGAV